jgi:hypothetical protein
LNSPYGANLRAQNPFDVVCTNKKTLIPFRSKVCTSLFRASPMTMACQPK